MKKLALTAATAAAILSSGLAQAQDWDHQRHYVAASVIGEGGAHWANQCWVETWGAGSSYFGYWKECEHPKVAKR